MRLLLLMMMLALVGGAALPAAAQDRVPVAMAPKGKDPPPVKKDDKAEDKAAAEKKVLKKLFKDIAAEFKAEDTLRLMKRVPKDEKLKLRLGRKKTETTYAYKQAKLALLDWFTLVRIVKLSDRKITGSSASWKMRVRNTKTGVEANRRLLVSVTRDGTGHRLTRLLVE
jgi:hypothetical protein